MSKAHPAAQTSREIHRSCVVGRRFLACNLSRNVTPSKISITRKARARRQTAALYRTGTNQPGEYLSFDQGAMSRVSSEEALYVGHVSQDLSQLARAGARDGALAGGHARVSAFAPRTLQNRIPVCGTQATNALGASAAPPPLECCRAVPVSGHRAKHQTAGAIPDSTTADTTCEDVLTRME